MKCSTQPVRSEWFGAASNLGLRWGMLALQPPVTDSPWCATLSKREADIVAYQQNVAGSGASVDVSQSMGRGPSLLVRNGVPAAPTLLPGQGRIANEIVMWSIRVRARQRSVCQARAVCPMCRCQLRVAPLLLINAFSCTAPQEASSGVVSPTRRASCLVARASSTRLANACC